MVSFLRLTAAETSNQAAGKLSVKRHTAIMHPENDNTFDALKHRLTSVNSPQVFHKDVGLTPATQCGAGTRQGKFVKHDI